MLSGLCALLPGRPSLAAPQGGVVVSGQATISANGATTNINQSTQQAIINWQLFSIAPKETVNFNQPGPTSVTLNRVIGNEKSIIEGALNANGQVFIVNSAGIVFTKSAQVNVGGLVASTLDISNNNFSAGKYQFSGNSTAPVINMGNIQTSPGGYVALLGNTVSNQGTITATLGTVVMASGDQVTLNIGGNALVDVTTDKGTLNALVENKGAIIADGGKVILTARAADALLSAQVNNTGVIQARTMAGLTGGLSHTGSIKLVANGGKVKVAGRLDASAPNGGNGGTIETSGAKVTVADDAVITTNAASGKKGLWLIDPDGFTIASSGGDITGTALSAELANSNVTILSTQGSGADGNINVNAPVSWSADTTLTLNATNNINVNASITATGANAGLALNYGGDYVFKDASTSITLSGANPSLTINGNAYQVINTLAQLEAISPDASTPANGFYALGGDINAGGVVFSGPVVNDLEGTLAGLNHVIRNLTINDQSAIVTLGAVTPNDALISTLGAAGLVRDVGMFNTNVNAGWGLATNGSLYGGSASALVNLNFGTISNSYAIGGSIFGQDTIGGLVAWNLGSITNSHTYIAVSGQSYVGGLVGANYPTGTIDSSYADGPVSSSGLTLDHSLTGSTSIGGLVGINYGVIRNSHATGSVTATDSFDVGGLVGTNSNLFGSTDENGNINQGVITNSYATGSVAVTLNNSNGINFTTSGVGGLAGSNTGGSITYSSASGNVTVAAMGTDTAGFNVGGLVGYNSSSIFGNGGIIDHTTASGAVTAVVGITFSVGGLVGNNSDPFTQVSNSSATGPVTIGEYQNAGINAGGLFGSAAAGANYSGNSWNISSTGQSKATGGGPTEDATGGAVGTNPASTSGPSAAPSLNALTQRFTEQSQAANVVANVDTAHSAATPPRPGVAASAGTGKTAALAGPSFSDMVSSPTNQTEGEWLQHKQSTDAVNARARAASLSTPPSRSNASPEAKEAPPPRRHVFAPPRPVAKPKGAGFGATIHSIEIEGKQYELHEKSGSKPQPPENKPQAPESKPQAPSDHK